MEKAFLCAITKNEGIDLAEWILFHLSIGFEKIIVYDNNSTDKTKDYVDACKYYGAVEYVHWPFPHGQLTAYADCLKRFSKDCDWMAFLDIDEFLVLPQHKLIPDFLNEISPYQAIAINWRIFGSNNEIVISQNLVVDTFFRRAIDSFSANRHIKSIVRPKYVDKVINPHYFKLKRISWRSLTRFKYHSPAGEVIEWLKPGKTITPGEANLARINHYFTKSREHYEKKIERGNADKKDIRKDVFEFNDKNEVYDTQILDIYKSEIATIRQVISELQMFHN